MSRVTQLLAFVLIAAVPSIGVWKTGWAVCSTDLCGDMQAHYHDGGTYCMAYEQLRCSAGIVVKDPDHNMKCEDQKETIAYWYCNPNLCNDLCKEAAPVNREHEFLTTECDDDDETPKPPPDKNGICWAFSYPGVSGCSRSTSSVKRFACEETGGGSQ